MRTRLILVEGTNHAHINPSNTHSPCVQLACEEVEVGASSSHFSALRRRAICFEKVFFTYSQQAIPLSTMVVSHVCERTNSGADVKHDWEGLYSP